VDPARRVGATRVRFEIGRARATARIAWDYARSTLRPVVRDPGGWPAAEARARAGAAAAPLPARFRLLTWNLHRGYRPAALRTSLERMVGERDPHLLLLQEVPVTAGAPFWEWDGIRPLLDGWHLFFAPMHRPPARRLYYPFDASGQLTASRSPVAHWEVLPLPTVSRPKLGRRHRVQRLALGVVVATRGAEVTIWNLHLENTTRPSGRGLQARRLVTWIAERPPRPTVVAGDCNTFFGRLEEVAATLGEAGFERAVVAGRRRLRPAIDHLFVRGLTVVTARELAAGGSDHRPIVAELEVPR
jgi:endonuclease/exonuclease/phosphatase family metal-dependent hydrolase